MFFVDDVSLIKFQFTDGTFFSQKHISESMVNICIENGEKSPKMTITHTVVFFKDNNKFAEMQLQSVFSFDVNNVNLFEPKLLNHTFDVAYFFFLAILATKSKEEIGVKVSTPPISQEIRIKLTNLILTKIRQSRTQPNVGYRFEESAQDIPPSSPTK